MPQADKANDSPGEDEWEVDPVDWDGIDRQSPEPSQPNPYDQDEWDRDSVEPA